MVRRRRRQPQSGDEPIEIAGLTIKNDVLFAVGGLVIGIIFLAVGLAMYSSSKELVKKGLITTGEVVSVRKTTRRINRRSETVYFPTIRFKATDNKTFTFEGEDSTTRMKKGRRLEVLYDPDDPKNARENSSNALWTMPLVLVIVGLACFVVAGVSGWKVFKKRNNA